MKSKPTIKFATARRLLMLAVIMFSQFHWLALAQGEKPLFQRVERQVSDLTPKQQSIISVLQAQRSTTVIEVVQLDDSALTDLNKTVPLNVTKDITLNTKLTAINRGVSTAFDGKTANPKDIIQLVKTNGSVTGTIRTDGKLFAVRPIGGGLHAIIHQDEAKFPPEHPEGVKMKENKPTGNLQDANPNAGNTNATLRILVAYTPAAAQSTADISALIQLAVDETNTGYTNSGVNLRAELADSFQVTYGESGVFATDLDRFRSRNDGVMDEVHTRRDQSRADVCVLLLANSSSCGLADAILATESTAFATVSTECATGYYSFAHEIGHLQGARHNPEQDNSNQPFPHGHGFVNEAGRWRTIMSYNCAGGCTRLPYWSNPNVQYNGAPTGTTAHHNNAKVLNDTAALVTTFRN